MINANNRALIVQEFLHAPDVRENFNAFFNLTNQHTSAYLKKLERIGYNLSPDKINNENSYDDLVYDILGSFFRSNLNNPYYLIFDYFKKQNIVSFENTEPTILYSKLQTVLYGFIHQELSKLTKQINPQVEKLKRRFKEILKGKEFEEINFKNRYATYYILSDHESHTKNNQQEIPFEELEEITMNAYHKSSNRVEWCMSIFKQLNRLDHYSNQIKKSDLLAVVVKVNVLMLDLPDIICNSISIPVNSAIRDEVQREKDHTIAYIKANEISKYINKGRLEKNHSETILTACYNYLDDFSVHSENDSLPSYLFELLPDLTQQEYQKDYKNICDNLFRKALEDFKNRLRNNSTIKSFRDYYI